MIPAPYDPELGDLEWLMERGVAPRARILFHAVPGGRDSARRMAAMLRGEPDPVVIPEPERIEPKLPGIVRMAVGFAQAVVAHIADGGTDVDDKEYDRRIAICDPCDNLRPSDRRCGKDEGCGCYVDQAARWRSKHCPIAKW